MESEVGMVLGLFVVVANVLGAGMIVPQVVRLRRLASTAGVSPTWIGIGLAMNLWWVAYGVSQSLWGMVPVSVVAAGFYSLIAAELHRIDGPKSLHLVVRGAIGIAAAPLLFLLVGGWASAGLAIGLIYAIQFAPAAVAAFRTNDVSGIAVTTWAMALGEAAIWFVYGLSTGDIALTIGGAGGGLMSGLILLRVAQLAKSTVAFASPAGIDELDNPTDWLISSPVEADPLPR